MYISLISNCYINIISNEIQVKFQVIDRKSYSKIKMQIYKNIRFTMPIVTYATAIFTK